MALEKMIRVKTCEEMLSPQAQMEEVSLTDQIIIKQEPNEQFVSLAVAAGLQQDDSTFSRTYSSGEGPQWQNKDIQLKCEECGSGLRSQSELHDHQLLHARQEEPAENGCMSVTKYAEDQIASKNKKIFMCEECGKIFQLKHHLVQHQAIHAPNNRYPCEMCGKSYRHKRDLIRHQHVHTRQKPLKCEKCGKCFELKHHLRRHEVVHSTDQQRFVCFMCSRTYKHQRDLIRHYYGHRGDKPLTCEHCGKCFELKHYLSWHEVVSDTNKPLPCAYCGKSCTRTQCPDEEEFKDAQAGEYIQCKKCDKSFKPNDLLRHQAVHSTERPYKCEVCGKSYKYRRDLTRHQPTHLETKPYSCDICGKGFLQKRYMIRHRFTHKEDEWTKTLLKELI